MAEVESTNPEAPFGGVQVSQEGLLNKEGLIKVEVFGQESPFGGVEVSQSGFLGRDFIRLEVSNPESPFGGVQVGQMGFHDGPLDVLVSNPEAPFGGVQVFEIAGNPTQIEFATGSPVLSVFGRIGNVTARCSDYDQCYAPLGTGLPAGGLLGQILAKQSDADYLAHWIDAPAGGPGVGATEVWEGPEAPVPLADYLLWIDTDAPTPVGGDFGELTTGEVPAGAINGTNTAYSTAAAFSIIWVYVNGLRLKAGLDFNVTSPTTFSMVSALISGDTLLVDYM